MNERHIAVLGAGPTGLEAALAAAEAGVSFTLYESHDDVSGNVSAWGHVRLFTPWSMNVSARARTRLEAAGHSVPDGDERPTGRELVDSVMRPIARLPDIAPRVRFGTRVLEVGRDGMLKNDEIGTGRRAERRFRLLVVGPDEVETVEFADIVLDCTGSYHNPNALGMGGIHAPGERSLESRITRSIPDFEAEEDEWAGSRVLLVGDGYSGQTAACDLAALIGRHRDTKVTWAIRDAEPTFGAVEGDPLPARARLVEQARSLAWDDGSPIDTRFGRVVEALAPAGSLVAVTLHTPEGGTEEVVVDRIVALTGSVGDATLYRQLQVHECWATSGPMKLAATLLAASSADCLTQTSQGGDTLENPEPDFFILGAKSYGRNATFLMRVGWEQVGEVFSLLGLSPADPG